MHLPWSRALSLKWTIAGMFSVSAPTDGDHHNVAGETTFVLGRQFAPRWDGFIEYAGDFPRDGGTRQLLHVGTAFRATRQQQFDLHIGVGLSSAAADGLIGAGYSFRVSSH